MQQRRRFLTGMVAVAATTIATAWAGQAEAQYYSRPEYRGRPSRRTIRSLQHQRNLRVLALQQQFNRRQISRGQLNAETRAIDRELNAQINGW